MSKYSRPEAIQNIRFDYTTKELQQRYDTMRAKIDAFAEREVYLYYQLNPEYRAYIDAPSKTDIFGRQVGGYDGSIEKFIKALYDKLEFLYTIRTKEKHLEQLERCERIMTSGGELSIRMAIFFDPQISEKTDMLGLIRAFPTFYSYYDPKLYDNKGGYGVAFPPRVTELTDEELTVALAHEFGHIRQGHCLEILMENTYVNEAMDFSINHQFQIMDLYRYIQLCKKLFAGGMGCTVLSWKEIDGGMDIPLTTTSEWKEILELIKIYHGDKKGPKPPGPPGPPQRVDDRVMPGDIVLVRGSSPNKYGRLISGDVDKGTGEVLPMTEAEFLAEYEAQKKAHEAAKAMA